MKRLLLTFALIFAFACAQAADITSISNAFKAGNASSLSGAMDKVVDVALPGSSKKCNGSEAVSMLSSFSVRISLPDSRSYIMRIKRKAISLSESFRRLPVSTV